MTPFFNEFVQHYEQLLNFSYRVINSMKGKPEPDVRLLPIEYLAKKIFLHAATLNHLRTGTNVTLSAYPHGSNVVDFPSAIVITRAILETYLNLFEVFFEPQDDDEFEYRRAVYEIEGARSIEVAVQRYPNPPTASAEDVFKTEWSLKALQNIRERIKQTKMYQSLDPNQQKATLEGKLYTSKDGKPHFRKFGEIGAAAGFGQTFIEHTYMNMSSFTHGDSLSAMQTNAAVEDRDKDVYFQIYMLLIMMVLTLLILKYAEKFPEAQTICDTSPNDMALVNRLAAEIKRT